MDNTEQFSQLTDFVHSEFQKILQIYGFQKMPEKVLNKITNSALDTFSKLNILNKKKVKFNIKVEWALFTMPHGFIWKLCHKRLWYHVKKRLNKEPQQQKESSTEEEPQTLYPQVVRPVDITSMEVLSEE